MIEFPRVRDEPLIGGRGYGGLPQPVPFRVADDAEEHESQYGDEHPGLGSFAAERCYAKH